MTRLERLGWELKDVYWEATKRFVGRYWFDGEKRMFHEDSWLVELMNREPEQEIKEGPAFPPAQSISPLKEA